MRYFTNLKLVRCIFHLKYVVLFVLLPFLAWPQTKNITGTIKGTDGLGIPGVTIMVAGGSAKAQTDGAGKFTINARPGDVLIARHLSYSEARITVDARTDYSLTIQLATGDLGEVVVVGFGTQKRTSISGSISTIDTKAIENRPVNNVVEALQGVAPGLIVTRNSGQPGNEGWKLNIRGISSVNGPNNPLLIVDGIEYTDLTQINPNDIESISVLKDAAAAAIYGAKAANGVMLITTKKGTANSKTKVNYTGLLSNKQIMNVPGRLNSWEEATLQNLANVNNNGTPAWTNQQIAWMQDPSQSFQPNDPTNQFYYYNTDPIKQFIRKSYYTQNHNLNISGGTESSQYFIGLGYNDNKGIFKFGPDNNDRYNARFNMSTKFNKIFSLDSRLSFIRNRVDISQSINASGDGGLLYNMYNIRRVFPIFNEDGSVFGGDSGRTQAWLEKGGYRRTTTKTFDGVFTLKADSLAKGLVLSATFSPRFEQGNQDRSLVTVPLYSWDKPSQKFLPTSFLNNPNSLYKQRITQNSYSANATAEYNLDLADHHFKALAGFQYQDYNYDLIYATKSNLVNNDLPTLNYTTLPNLPINAVGDAIQTNTWVSLFGRFNYNYKDKYYLEFVFRNDATSRLAPGYKSQNFPGFSAAWRLTQEKWFSDNLKFVNEFKLRASYGKLGNALLSENAWERNYDYVPTLSNGIYPFNNSASATIFQSGLPSPAIGWEIIKTYNIGLDMAFLNNRLTASFDYFKKANDNMLFQVALPDLLGVTPSTTNALSMETKGWEFNASWKDKAGELNYGVGFNISDNKNKITDFKGSVVYREGVNRTIPGYSVNSIFGYRTTGYFQSQEEVTNSPKQFGSNNQGPGDYKYQDIDGNNLINGGLGTEADHGDLVYLGNTDPRYSFGLNLNAQWKGIDATVFLQGVGKRNFQIFSSEIIPFVNSWRYPHDDYRDNYWTPERPNAQYPRPLSGGGTNTRVNSSLLQNGAYIRLKNVQLGYTFKKSLTEKVNIDRLRIFFTAQDIWTASKMKFKYFDPESPNNVAFNYPYAATYAFGLNVTF
ncbi:TonB-dependent receptor [Pedobacter steynii]|nr:TonB-dependent receptor [Pedobacter steynii]NQX40817.1 TonB-dependent receptor [Pedobacter steynii]